MPLLALYRAALGVGFLLVCLVVILPRRGPLVSKQLLFNSVLAGASIWRVPGVTIHIVLDITTP